MFLITKREVAKQFSYFWCFFWRNRNGQTGIFYQLNIVCTREDINVTRMNLLKPLKYSQIPKKFLSSDAGQITSTCVSQGQSQEPGDKKWWWWFEWIPAKKAANDETTLHLKQRNRLNAIRNSDIRLIWQNQWKINIGFDVTRYCKILGCYHILLPVHNKSTGTETSSRMSKGFTCPKGSHV